MLFYKERTCRSSQAQTEGSCRARGCLFRRNGQVEAARQSGFLAVLRIRISNILPEPDPRKIWVLRIILSIQDPVLDMILESMIVLINGYIHHDTCKWPEQGEEKTTSALEKHDELSRKTKKNFSTLFLFPPCMILPECMLFNFRGHHNHNFKKIFYFSGKLNITNWILNWPWFLFHCPHRRNYPTTTKANFWENKGFILPMLPIRIRDPVPF